ncbi:pickpocket protein 28-like [Diorhabda sublineata]|uniref:pickpocket protein 28-like n=1 Tax=Diorhabda sublineata TaxID=1163346 RepID=UPI0024E0DBFE|nr:pickpocket protein 28-like [Diorhabda sublineata]XP_056643638.1 pickpocket protein 28-like [Diorhabda sublineata]XP_056643639.1 pickpocket protein 28-like [Diorhabda sublineata]XP_056643640.1 pickpocket protein 28-like [Diorhabda sublineata]
MHKLTVERKREKPNSWSRFQHYFNDYCEHSSIIGFNYVAEKRSKGERILWITLIIIATALSIYFIKEQYDKYDENPFIVSLATRETPIFQIPFPAITICPFTKAAKSLFNFTDVVHKLWDNISVSEYEIQTAQYMSMICDDDNLDIGVSEYIPEILHFNETFYERLDKLNPTSTLIDSSICKYMGEEFECLEYFSPIILDGGICYTFNMLNRDEIFKSNVHHYSDFHSGILTSDWDNDDGYRKGTGQEAYPRRALQAGADNSFDLIIMAFSGDSDPLCSIDVGYSITVHTPHSIPKTKKDYFILPLGSSTRVIVTPNVMSTSTTVKSYKTEDRKCYFSDERILHYFVSYTQGNCYLECFTNYTLQKCGCVHFYMPHEKDTPICGNYQRNCLQEAESELKTLEIEVAMGLREDSLSCNCYPLCSQLTYQTSITRTQWEWKEYYKAHKKLRTELNFSDDLTNELQFSRLKIYFKDDLFFSYEKNELYGIFDFISNFGGLLGLFTGFSLLTVAEIIYYISVRMWCNKRLYNDISGPPDSD